MEYSERPGGLTFFSIINFIVAAISPFILEATGNKSVISYIIVLLYPAITLIVLNLIYRKKFSK